MAKSLKITREKRFHSINLPALSLSLKCLCKEPELTPAAMTFEITGDWRNEQ